MVTRFDRTRAAVARQLKGMACPLYEVGLHDAAEDKVLPRFFTPDQVLKSLSWLKVMNAKGNDVFIRPRGSVGLVFFDDLTNASIKKMDKNGHGPSILIESSPLNYHGWVRVCDQEIPRLVATQVAKYLCALYGGDKDSADWRHYGRLAGFTNRKRIYKDEQGRSPFTLVARANTQCCANGVELIAQAMEHFARNIKAGARAPRSASKPFNTLRRLSPDKYYLSLLAKLTARYGGNLDKSRADWVIVRSMACAGYDRHEIKECLALHSPALTTRTSHGDKYIDTTLANFFGDQT